MKYVLFILCLFALSAPLAQAKSVSSNQQLSKSFYYYTHTNDPMLGLVDPNVTVSYSATVTNADTGAVIADGATVPVGTHVKLTPKSFDSNDIYWFGSGASNDSPYGDWGTSGPSSVTCQDKDYFATVQWTDPWSAQCNDPRQNKEADQDPSTDPNAFKCTYNFDLYAPFYVAPPTRNVSASSNLSCGAPAGDGSVTCTVTSAGASSMNISFGPTTGQFYYRYSVPQSEVPSNGQGSFTQAGCSGNNIPMGPSTYTAGQPTLVSVPTQSISFPFTATQNNRPPSTPTLSCQANGKVGDTISFTVSGTDPDSDQIRYGIDWVGDGSITQWVPSSGYVASGASQTFTRSWASPGTYSVRALSQDVGSANSSFSAPCTVTIAAATAPDLAAGTVSPSTAGAGTPVSLTAPATNIGTATSGSFPMLFQIQQNGSDVGLINSPYGSGLAPSNSQSMSASYTFNTAGSYQVRACANYNTSWTNITAESDYTNNCGPWTTVTVPPAPAPDLTAGAVSPTTVGVGTPTSITAVASNIGNATSGSFPMLFQIQQNGSDVGLVNTSYGSGLASSNSQPMTASYTFGSAGSYQVRACANFNTSWTTITPESDYTNNCGPWTTVTATNALTGTCSVSPSSITTGQAATWTAAPSGGVGNYTYAWSGTDGLSGSASSVTKTYGTSGTKSGSVVITSGGSSVTVSCSNSLTVTDAPAADLTAGAVTPTTAGVGSATTLTALATNIGNATSGSFPMLFQIQQNGSDLGLVNSSYGAALAANGSRSMSAAYTFSSSGSYQVRACANYNTAWTAITPESDYTNNCGPWTTVTASNALSGSCSVSPSTITAGQSATWTVTPSGGVGGYGYAWSGTDSLSGSASSVTKTYASTGTKTASVVITSGSSSVTVTCSNSLTVSVGTAPDLTTGATSPTSIQPQQLTTFVATVTNKGNAATGASFKYLFQVATNSSGANAGDGAGGTAAALAAGANTTASVTYTFPSAGTWYTRICADKASAGDAGAIAESDETNNCGPWTQVNVVAAPTPPSTPTNLSYTCNAAGTQATLTWSASTNASYYWVRIWDSGTCPSGWTHPQSNPAICLPSPTDAVYGTSVTYATQPGVTHSWAVTATNDQPYPQGASGDANGSFICNAQQGAPQPTCTLTATPSNSLPSLLRWSSTNATSCTGSGFNAGGMTSGALSESTAGNYTVSCTGTGGTCSTMTTITNSCTNPTGNLTASPTRVRQGSSATLSYSATGITGSCVITGPSGTVATLQANSCTVPSGNVSSGAIQSQSIFILKCDGVERDRVVVNVLPQIGEF